MAALVAVMIVARSAPSTGAAVRLSTLKRMPKSETAVMLITVVDHRVDAQPRHRRRCRRADRDDPLRPPRRALRHRHPYASTKKHGRPPPASYTVNGELFFASSNDLTTQFEYTHDPERVIIDMSQSHIWDASTVAALDAIVT